MSAILDLAGQEFGRWRVVDRAKSLNGCAAWHCVCICGTRRVVRGSWLNRGKSLSCGCLAAQMSSDRNRVHGMKGTKVYKAWDCMKQRCHNPRHKSYASYGARGIAVCPRWLQSFEAFYEDMGQPPSARHSIDRIDNDRGYEPSNCRWATAKEQARNRRSSTFIEAFGQRKIIAEWAEDSRCAVSLGALGKRLDAGWDAERAIAHPRRPVRQSREPVQERLFS